MILFDCLKISRDITSSVRQKGKSQNGCFKKTKHPKFSKKRTFFTPWYAHVSARIRGKKMFVFWKIWRTLFSWNTHFEIHPFEIHPFALLPTTLALSMPASVSDLGYFCSCNVLFFLQFFKAFFFYIFILDNSAYFSCKSERYIC